MLYWMNGRSVSLFRAFFLLGVLGALLVSVLMGSTVGVQMSIAVIVCVCAVAITLTARLLSQGMMKYVQRSIGAAPWSDLSREQFDSMGLPAKFAFSVQLAGLLVAAFAFGWMLLSMVLVLVKGMV